jgi:hypothetical protein
MTSHRWIRWSIGLAAAAAMAACSDNPSSPDGPSARMGVSRSMNTTTATTTTWDFVALSGADGPQGNPKTYSISGAGSVVASASVTDPATQVYSKGSADAPGTAERGLGLCRNVGTGGACVATNGDFEIGDVWPDGAVPSMFLDFTGLTAGSAVTSVTVSSVQFTEGWSIASSTDGSTYTTFSTGTGTDSTNAVYTIPVPAGTNYLRFDAGPGSAGNDYLVQSVTVTTQPFSPAIGRMTGGGSDVDINGTKVTKGLTLHCDITLSNNLEVNWAGHHWHLDKPIDTADCENDPAYNPKPPAAPFNTFNGTATGQLDGVDGSKIAFTFIDAGEPGAGTDKAAIQIWDASGNLVLDVPLSFITGGNLQAHYDQPHGCNVNKC